MKYVTKDALIWHTRWIFSLTITLFSRTGISQQPVQFLICLCSTEINVILRKMIPIRRDKLTQKSGKSQHWWQNFFQYQQKPQAGVKSLLRKISQSGASLIIMTRPGKNIVIDKLQHIHLEQEYLKKKGGFKLLK